MLSNATCVKSLCTAVPATTQCDFTNFFVQCTKQVNLSAVGSFGQRPGLAPGGYLVLLHEFQHSHLASQPHALAS